MIDEVLESIKRHLDYVNATNQKSIRDIEIEVMYKEIERLNNIIKELEKWLKFFNENGLVIDLEEGKQTTVMPTLAVIEKIEELKENK